MIEIPGVEVLGAEAQTCLAGPNPEHNTIGAAIVIELAEPVAPGDLLAAVKRRVASTLDFAPRLRKIALRLPTHAPLHVLADAPELDLDAHIQLVAADAEVSLARLSELLLMFNDQPMDPGRPLWRVMVVPRIEGGRAGVAFRVHHFIQDGVMCAVTGAAMLLDDAPDRPLRTPEPYAPAPLPTPEQLQALAHDVHREHRHEVRTLLGGAVGHPAHTLNTVRQIHTAYHEELSGTPSTLLARRSDRRALELVQVTRADVRAAQDVLGHHVSFNDVVVTAMVGGLAAMLDPVDKAGQTVRVEVPVTVALQDGGPNEFDKHAALMVLELPLDEPDPLAVLRIAHEQSARRKTTDARALERLMHAYMLLPMGAFERLSAKAWEGGNLLFSDIPGPTGDLFVTGHRVQSIYGVGNLRGASSLRVVVLSFGDHVTFGILYDQEAVPVHHITRGITDTLARLQPDRVTSQPSR